MAEGSFKKKENRQPKSEKEMKRREYGQLKEIDVLKSIEKDLETEQTQMKGEEIKRKFEFEQR